MGLINDCKGPTAKAHNGTIRCLSVVGLQGWVSGVHVLGLQSNGLCKMLKIHFYKESKVMNRRIRVDGPTWVGRGVTFSAVNM